MYRIEVHKNIQRISEFLYRVGFWSRHEKETVRERRLKFFYSIYFWLFIISIVTGLAESDDRDGNIFSVLVLLTIVIAYVRLLHLIWKKKEILKYFNQICVYDSDDRDTYTAVIEKLKFLMKFVVFFLSVTCFTVSSILFVAPFVGAERKLFFQIGFPLDWRKSEVGYWMAFIFIVTEAFIGTISITFPVFIWYLMANCSWRYEVLGLKIRKMGEIASDESTPADQRRISKIERDNLYNRDLVGAITSYNSLKEYK